MSDRFFHSRDDFLLAEHFAPFDLPQALFNLAAEPFIVTNQTLDRFVHRRFGIASLQDGEALQLGISLGRKVEFQDASLEAAFGSVKAEREPA